MFLLLLQTKQLMKYLIAFLIFAFLSNSSAIAITDPRLFPNNKFGINSLSPEVEVKGVADLVNTNGDWGWVVVVIRKDERDLARWQSIFNSLLENHLSPIVRIATSTDSQGNWQKPTAEDAQQWANFLESLSWPTKNHYVQVYNEVNRKTEWGGKVDASQYAFELERTIDALKAKSEDFFVLNAPLDLSANSSGNSLDAAVFFQTMEASVPGIFKKLDGWASHSYPNPDFSASPLKSGRTGIGGYKWELTQINNYSTKNLPVFITETGWRNSSSEVGGLTESDIANYYKTAFEKVWNDSQVVVVAPFVFNYPEALFKAFSFRDGKSCSLYCQTLKDIFKIRGDPQREDVGQILTLEHSFAVINNSTNKVDLKIKNSGNYIWNTKGNLKINLEASGLEMGKITWGSETIYPGQVAKASVEIKVAKEGILPFTVRITSGDEVIAQKESAFRSETYFAYIINTIRTIFGSVSS